MWIYRRVETKNGRETETFTQVNWFGIAALAIGVQGVLYLAQAVGIISFMSQPAFWYLGLNSLIIAGLVMYIAPRTEDL